MDLYLLRAIERYFIDVSGLICIILGYTLFRISYTKTSAAMSKSTMSSEILGFRLKLSSSWPGLFFAMFGMIILVVSISVQLSTATETNNNSSKSTNSYFDGGTLAPNELERVVSSIQAINEAIKDQMKRSSGSEPPNQTLIIQLQKARVSLVDVGWGKGAYSEYLALRGKDQGGGEFEKIPKEKRQQYQTIKGYLED